MSAIVGIYNLDDRPVQRADIERMVDKLAHRGPDGAGVWQESGVGFGHCMLRTTPESLHEELPFTDKSRELTITADARIDNRKELTELLGISAATHGQWSDSQFILAAYVKWGEDCPQHLLGDFAFVIWDERNRKLFCARDHFGVKPFYYYHAPGKFLAFASEIKGLLCLSDVPKKLNEMRVAEYLTDMFDDPVITFYTGIMRLPPAHVFTVTRKSIHLDRYWSLDPNREILLDSDEDYAAKFREIFTEAVRCRLRSASRVSAMLSGGLDSSSIACLARDLLRSEISNKGKADSREALLTISTVFDEFTECDERQYINAVLEQQGFEPHYLIADHIGPLENIETVLWHEDEPFYAPNLCSSWPMYSMARDQGARVILDGHGGDEVVSHGIEYVKELATTGKWWALAKELRRFAEVEDLPFKLLLWRLIRKYKINPLRSRLAKFRALRLIKQFIKPSILPIDTSSSWARLLNPLFAEHLQMTERRRTWEQSESETAMARETHYKDVTGGLQPFALEVLDRAAAASFVEARYPLWDKRLVEFCVALPANQKLRNGWSRSILRRSMQDILPPSVQWRKGKLDFTPYVVAGLYAQREQLDALILNDKGNIENFVNTSILKEAHRRFFADQNREKAQIGDRMLIWKAASLALWMQNAQLDVQ